MAEHDDDHHGNSLAAWVMVGIVLLGAAIMAVGFVIPSLAVIIGGAVVMVIGLIAGKVLALAGHGVNGAISRSDTNIS
ncbi:HGxxPAAW family protein [Knoellia sp. Soil729]|uniref:HGxxPAAW family protein n=1 Tax=Knoellia sp. Soil729 TaxID=1736394 RepID=UPI0006F8BC58|nr:HGxxPAAW family protein [Knoellia sp. Soil729]KRE41290.1 anthranilate synthase [Knoellia sp. Soil729]